MGERPEGKQGQPDAQPGLSQNLMQPLDRNSMAAAPGRRPHGSRSAMASIPRLVPPWAALSSWPLA